MNVKELIDALRDANPTDIVMLSSDEEGNSYRLAHVSLYETFCKQDNEYVSVDEDDEKDGYYEGWEEHMFKAVCFW